MEMLAFMPALLSWNSNQCMDLICFLLRSITVSERAYRTLTVAIDWLSHTILLSVSQDANKIHKNRGNEEPCPL